MKLPWPNRTNIHSEEFAQSEARFFAYMKSEEERKERLSELFSELEDAERKYKKPLGQPRKYEKMYRGFISVTSKRKNRIILHRENGLRFNSIGLPKEIISLLRKEDSFDGVFGFRQGQWRVISVFCIGSVLPPENELSGL